MTNTTRSNGSDQQTAPSLGIENDSVEIARRAPQGRWHEVEINAPYVAGKTRIGTDIVARDAVIEIRVRELQGNELGALASPDFGEHVRRAVERKNQEDHATYGRTTRELEQDARRSGYYGSPAHQVWAEAAEARTGGRLSSEWWMRFDPYGGTAGNGPNILPTGSYPGVLSRISMAHDTDWSLGRHFQAGPLRALYGVGHDAETRGAYGLNLADADNPIRPRPHSYDTPIGHPDWKVNYIRNPNRRADLDGGSDVAVALAPGNEHVNRQFEQALRATGGDRDSAALAVDTIRNAPGYKADEAITVMAGRNGLIVSQGQGDAALNLQIPQATPGDFDRVAARLQQADPAQGLVQQTQQIALTQQDPERMLPGRAV